MSNFEKLLVPLIWDGFKSIDFTKAAGFIDCYTSDPDKPSLMDEFFIVYDDTVRNEWSEDVAIRFDKSPYLKRKYVKYVDGTPYFVYSFWIKPELKKLYTNVQTITASQKVDVLMFWGPFDKRFSEFLVGNSAIGVDWKHEMPLADYNADPKFDKNYL